MAKLKKLWIEHHANSKPAIRIDWDNERSQRIEIVSNDPFKVAEALKEAGEIVNFEIKHGLL